jgi:hypothetical protein
VHVVKFFGGEKMCGGIEPLILIDLTSVKLLQIAIAADYCINVIE